MALAKMYSVMSDETTVNMIMKVELSPSLPLSSLEFKAFALTIPGVVIDILTSCFMVFDFSFLKCSFTQSQYILFTCSKLTATADRFLFNVL